MLTLNEKDLKDLNAFIQELPLKHGLPLLNFINAKMEEQVKKEIPEELIKKELK
jgi:hypothetical protein